ncbi:MAG: ATP-binding protein [Gammaproteobacteria bacterium]|nr:MAG: ATP-binding protein [Gammaproteobacteria bacterium]
MQNIRRDPDLFLNNTKLPVIFDEVEYAPELIPALKRFIDKNKRPGQFLLTGSQQWGVLNTIAESLAGRAIIITLDGFSLAEIANMTNNKPWLLHWLDNPDQFLAHPPNRLSLPSYSNNPIKRISEKPKGYFADTGQVCYSQMISSPEAIAAHPLWGALFENAVVSELRKQANLISTPPQFYHWRLYSGAEVDLVLERDGKFYPIEIKAKSKVTSQDAKNITAFRKLYSHLNVQKGLIIAPTESRYAVTENDWVMPWDCVVLKKSS